MVVFKPTILLFVSQLFYFFSVAFYLFFYLLFGLLEYFSNSMFSLLLSYHSDHFDMILQHSECNFNLSVYLSYTAPHCLSVKMITRLYSHFYPSILWCYFYFYMCYKLHNIFIFCSQNLHLFSYNYFKLFK